MECERDIGSMKNKGADLSNDLNKYILSFLLL